MGGSRGIVVAINKRLARESAGVALTYASSSDQADEATKTTRVLSVHALAIKADRADATVLARE